MNSTSFRHCLVVAGLLTGSSLFAAGKIERVVEKTFSVNGAGLLRVETSGGGVRVAQGSGTEVKVVARQKIRADSEAEADELLKKLTLTMEQSGNDVALASKYESRPAGFRFGSWPPVQVEFTVTVPATFSVDLRTSGGGIIVGDLKGTADVRTSGGGIVLGRIGGTVKARTSGGGITLAEAGADVDLDTSGGGIAVGRVAGAAWLGTSGGSIKIELVENALQAHTSGGGIHARIAGPLRAECSLSTSGGSVQVEVDKAAAFQLDASTSGGHVDANGLTMTVKKSDRSRLAGDVNGGGPLLKLRSSGGGIGIRVR